MSQFINFEQIYNEYIKIPPFEIEEYMKLKSVECGYSIKYFYKLLDKYVSQLSIEKQNIYENKRDIVLFSKKQEVKYINQYLNDKCSFKQVLLIGPKKRILYYLNKYAHYFKEEKERIDEIKRQLDILMIKNSDNLESLGEDIHNNMTIMLSILAHNTIEGATLQIERYRLDKTTYYIFLNHFIDMFPDELEKIKYLKEIGELYYEKETQIDFLPKYIIILRKVLVSGYSIEEYCSVTGESISNIKNAFSNVSKDYQMEVKEIKNILENRDKTVFYNMIRRSAYEMLNNKDFDMLDYYDLTHLSIDDYLNICKELIYDQKIMKRVTDFLRIKMQELRRKINVKKSEQLKIKTIIAGREVSIEEKEQAYDYLEEHNYPDLVYSLVLEKMVKGTLSNQKNKK